MIGSVSRGARIDPLDLNIFNILSGLLIVKYNHTL